MDIPGVHRFVTGSLRQNCYVIANSAGDAVIVDPGDDFESIAAYLAERELRVHGVLATHAHDDHIGAVVQVIKATGASFYMHGADTAILQRANFYRVVLRKETRIEIPPVDVYLDDRTSMCFGTLEVAVIHTPGHTPGSVSFGIGNELFTGDTLLADGLGRTDFPGGDSQALRESIARISAYGGKDTVIHPGHGESVRLNSALRPLTWLAQEHR